MKKVLLLFLLFFTIGCGAQTATETAVTPDSSAGTPADAPTTAAAPAAAGDGPAITPEEAAVIRDSDHVKGAADPAVVVIEYGDFQ